MDLTAFSHGELLELKELMTDHLVGVALRSESERDYLAANAPKEVASLVAMRAEETEVKTSLPSQDEQHPESVIEVATREEAPIWFAFVEAQGDESKMAAFVESLLGLNPLEIRAELDQILST